MLVVYSITSSGVIRTPGLLQFNSTLLPAKITLIAVAVVILVLRSSIHWRCSIGRWLLVVIWLWCSVLRRCMACRGPSSCPACATKRNSSSAAASTRGNASVFAVSKGKSPLLPSGDGLRKGKEYENASGNYRGHDNPATVHIPIRTVIAVAISIILAVCAV